MSIRPPSDIVLDVARAADPTQFAEASRRLTRGVSVDALAFDAALDRAAGSRPRHLVDAAGELATRRTNAALHSGGASGAGRRVDDVYSRFEAMALSTFVESMLPSRGDAVFGEGTSGRIWKGMMAEKIAAQLAEAGGIGIADQMRAAAALRGMEADGATVVGGAEDRRLDVTPFAGGAAATFDFDQQSGDLS
jgi:hypothetical protein